MEKREKLGERGRMRFWSLLFLLSWGWTTAFANIIKATEHTCVMKEEKGRKENKQKITQLSKMKTSNRKTNGEWWKSSWREIKMGEEEEKALCHRAGFIWSLFPLFSCSRLFLHLLRNIGRGEDVYSNHSAPLICQSRISELMSFRRRCWNWGIGTRRRANTPPPAQKCD